MVCRVKKHVSYDISFRQRNAHRDENRLDDQQPSTLRWWLSQNASWSRAAGQAAGSNHTALLFFLVCVPQSTHEDGNEGLRVRDTRGSPKLFNEPLQYICIAQRPAKSGSPTALAALYRHYYSASMISRGGSGTMTANNMLSLAGKVGAPRCLPSLSMEVMSNVSNREGNHQMMDHKP